MMSIKKKSHILMMILLCAALCAGGLLLQTDEAAAASKPSVPKDLSMDRYGSAMDVSWSKVSNGNGYTLQYAKDRFFLNRVTITISGASQTSQYISDLDSDSEYYVRVRSLKKKDGKIKYSGWILSDNVAQDKRVRPTRVKKGLRKFEVRSLVKEKVGEYDTVQGSCYGKGCIYFVLNNRDTNKCKIARVRFNTLELEKLSPALKLHHGNDITYNTKTNRLVVAHSSGATKTVSIINPQTLRIISNKKVELPSDLPGMSKNRRKYYNGFGGIAYNKKHNKYVVLLRGKNFHHLMILNSKLTPVKFLSLDVKMNQTPQGIDSYDNFILVGQSYSAGKPWNNVLVYDWEGNYLSRLNFSKKMELQSIFHAGQTFYASYYTSFYKYKVLKGDVLYRENYLYRLSNL